MTLVLDDVTKDVSKGLKSTSYMTLILEGSTDSTYLQDESEWCLNNVGKHLVDIWHMMIS